MGSTTDEPAAVDKIVAPERPLLSMQQFEKRANEIMSDVAKGYYNYTDSTGETLCNARKFYDGIRLAPRILTGDLTNIDLSCTLLGQKADVPVIIAPTAFHVLAHKDGEVATARGAGRAGVTYSYNWWLSMRLAEEVLAEPGPKWLHLYIFEERHGVERILREAEELGCFTGIIVSGDRKLRV
jgi:4-hydroxymandelate oxidase